MDKYLEIIVYYLTDWEQTAIANTRYSVVLAATAFFIGWVFVAFWNKRRINGLNKLLEEEKQKLQEAEQKQEQLLEVQKSDAEQTATLQKQLDQTSEKLTNLESVSAEQVKQIEQQTVQLDENTKQLAEKQNLLDQLNQSNNDKIQQLNTLTTQLDQIQGQLKEAEFNHQKLAEKEKENNDLSSRLATSDLQVQQLRTDLSAKNQQVEQLKLEASLGNVNNDRVRELEAEISALKQGKDAESIQRDIEKRHADSQSAHSIDLENTIKLQNQQIEQFSAKLQQLLTQPDTDSSSKAEEQESDGLVNKFYSFISTRDKAENETADSAAVSTAEQTTDVWKKHQSIIDQLIQQLSPQQLPADAVSVEQPQPTVQPELTKEPEVVKPEPVATAAEPVVSKEEASQTTVSEPFEELPEKQLYEDTVDYSEQLNELADTLDAFQNKVKGFFRKKKSD